MNRECGWTRRDTFKLVAADVDGGWWMDNYTQMKYGLKEAIVHTVAFEIEHGRAAPWFGHAITFHPIAPFYLHDPLPLLMLLGGRVGPHIQL